MRTGFKTALAIALTLPAAAGCEKTPKDRLQGRWLGESIENVPEAQVQKATGWVKGTAIEFSGNKVTVTIPAESPRSGQFKVSKVENDAMTVSFLREEGGRDEAELRLVGEDTMRWNIGSGREVVLVKAKN
jgi:hypothetical protein